MLNLSNQSKTTDFICLQSFVTINMELKSVLRDSGKHPVIKIGTTVRVILFFGN